MMTLYTAAITLIFVMDPLGNIPIFLSILKNYDLKAQRRIIIRETFVAFIVLCAFLFFGKYLIEELKISTSALSISGAIILFLIAIRMIFPAETNEVNPQETEEPFIVPLAVPLTAGPAAIAMVMLFVTQNPQHLPLLFFAVVISSLVFLIVMLLARYLMRLLGKRGLIAMERLMGMILTAIAVQMFLTGLYAYLH